MMTSNRREMLKDMTLGAGSLVLSPILARLHAQAAGRPVTAKRFIFVVESNGVPPDQLAPSGIKRTIRWRDRGAEQLFEASLADRDLPVSLEPVAEFKDRVTILQGLSGRVTGGGHSSHFATLGCFPANGQSVVGGETIDGALARAVPGIFAHVGLGVGEQPARNVIYNLSAAGPDKPLPTLCKPDRAYAALFGSVASREEFTAKNNLLDFLADDVRRVESRLAAPEREQLDVYLETLETLRNRQSRLNEIGQTLRDKGPVVSDKYKSNVETDRLDAHFDLGAAALVCGLTNVLTISSGAGNLGYLTYRGLGIPIDGHQIGHGMGHEKKTAADLYNMIRSYHFELIARLALKLHSVKEGDGTMLDNTLIVYLSDAAEQHHSNAYEWPIVLVGNLGRKLRSGRYIDYPAYGRQGHRTTANLFTTLLQLAGSSRESFGVADPNLGGLDQKGPLAELLA